jgi:hypothetical protein
MGYDERDSRGFPKRWTGRTATGTNQATAFLLLDGGYHEFTTVGSGSGASLPVVMPWSREITISNNGANALLIYPPAGGTIDRVNSSVSLPAGSSATYWATSPTNWQDRVTGGSGGGGGGGNSTIAEVSQTVSFTASAGAFYAVSGSAAVTAKLPTAVGIAGQTIRIRCTNGYTGLCTITGTSSQTIAGAASRIIYAGESPLFQSDGANWVRTGGTLIPSKCRMIFGANQSVPNSTATIMNFGTTDIDNSGHMGTPGSNGITIIRPEGYRLSATSVFAGLINQGYRITISPIKNTTITSNVLGETTLAAPGEAFNGLAQFTTLQTYAAGDLIQISIVQTNTAATAQTLTGSEGNSLCIEEILSW